MIALPAGSARPSASAKTDEATREAGDRSRSLETGPAAPLDGPSPRSTALLVLGTWCAASWALLAVSLQISERYPSPYSIAPLALSLCLVTLNAGWIAVGRGWPFGRFLLGCAMLLLLARASAEVTGISFFEWAGFHGIISCLVAIPLLLLRLLGWGMGSTLPGSNPAAAGPSRQFTIGGLFLLTTCSAIIFGSLHWVELPDGSLGVLVSFALAWAGIPLLVWLGMLVRMNPVFRGTALLGSVALATAATFIEEPYFIIGWTNAILVAHSAGTAVLLTMLSKGFRRAGTLQPTT